MESETIHLRDSKSRKDQETLKSFLINVKGVVQGVGFRPFIFNLARRHSLMGRVCNTSEGVRIEVEGPEDTIERFIWDIRKDAPPIARIEEMEFHLTDPVGYREFSIMESQSLDGKYQLISPDIATCDLCLKELFDPSDRRYRYPFTNCTNCGPRFTIIEDIPYDRPRTTMRHFTMCEECQKEYDDPMDRRFHAQPNACPGCGPKVELSDKEGRTIDVSDPISCSSALIKDGKILAIKGLGGFLLACDATNPEAVRLLRKRKGRPSKPFAVMMKDVYEVERHCYLSDEERKILKSSSSPIVLLRQKKGSTIASDVAPNLKELGVMLPYTPLHHLLLREVDRPLVMTSGNISEEPIAMENGEAFRKLAQLADFFLVHDRGIHSRYDDSVVRVESGKLKMIRRARGYAPFPIHLPFKVKEILGCGADLKNTFCLARDQYAFMSQHIGDMENLETLRHFERTVSLYKGLFRVEPKIIAHDLHPDYLSTHYAREIREKDSGVILVPVQHHHAHIVSCMAENHAEPPVIGVAFDGTGFGEDGHIWGGEFMVVDYEKFRRIGHLQYTPMPGGDAAIKRPYRMAISYLLSLLGERALENELPLFYLVGREEVAIVKKQIERGLNSPLTSSAGRLFDGVSALIGLRGHIDYEAQAAIELEAIASEGMSSREFYSFEIGEKNGSKVVLLRRIFSGIISDLNHNVSRKDIALKFHKTMALIIVRVCQLLSQTTGIRRVALSGGCFQNHLLSSLSQKYLNEAGFDVITHSQVPCNDGGVSLGQAVIANFIADI